MGQNISSKDFMDWVARKIQDYLDNNPQATIQDLAERPLAAHLVRERLLVDERHRDVVADAVDRQQQQGDPDLARQLGDLEY